MKIRIIGCLLVLVACLGRAHGPYDSSAQLIILSDSLEFRATLGMDGARQLLVNAGLSDADVASALSLRGPSTRYDLPVEVARHMVDLTAGGQLLKAMRVRVMTDGLEASLTATYAGSYSGDLSVRVRYFDGIEAMKPGAFVVTDENHNIKDQAVFSRTKVAAEIHLPGQVAQEIAGKDTAVITAAPNNVSSVALPPLAAPEGSAGPASSWLRVLWIGGVILLASLIWLGLRAMNRKR